VLPPRSLRALTALLLPLPLLLRATRLPTRSQVEEAEGNTAAGLSMAGALPP
jgi:hypothetical protein